MFENRESAGRALADELKRRGVEADVVLGIPRGALPVAAPVADALDATLDVVVARKMGAPNNPELAIGAVASDGTAWHNDDLIERLGVTEEYLETIRAEEAANAREKADRYRQDPAPIEDRHVIVVDDGVATGATAIACLRQVRNQAARVTLAVPVGSPDSVSALEAEADDVIALETPPTFQAVGQFYREFGQVSDEAAMAYLDR